MYDADPKTTTSAHRFERLSYNDILRRDLRVMDTPAIALARENGVPILVFSIHNPGELREVVHGQGKYTLIEG